MSSMAKFDGLIPLATSISYPVKYDKGCEHYRMSEIRLVDENGNLAADAAGRILAHCVFPNDEASRNQAMLVLRDENRQFHEEGGLPNCRPTMLVNWIVSSANGEAGQRAVAGYTTIAFAILAAEEPNKELTLYSAANVVARVLKAAKKADP